ncbi:subtilisin-like protein, partial [Basidiobolus meristosporus CBS 931.73]
DQRTLPLDHKYDSVDSGGLGVDIFIVDTGIFLEHSDFDGRAKSGVAALVGPDGDGNGHGTFVAGIIGGKRYGVAKQANLISVKALSDRGYGTTSSVLRGLQYVYLEHQTKENKKTVLNLSIMSNFSRIINEAVNETALSGIVVVVINATEGVDACGYSPVSAANVISVGSTNIMDRLSTSSNYGPCVTLYAPGENVTSDFVGSSSAISTLSGTSFATAHVSGVAALILSNHTDSLLPSEVRERIISLSTRNAIVGLPANSVNRL